MELPVDCWNVILSYCDEVTREMVANVPNLTQVVPRTSLSHLELCRLASKLGYLDVLKWMCSEYGVSNFDNISTSTTHIHVLVWLLSRGAKIGSTTIIRAARKGRVDTLEWALSMGFTLDYRVPSNAALKGHLHVLEWSKSVGLVFNRTVCDSAASGGHTRVVSWLMDHTDYEKYCTSMAYAYAAFGGHLEVIKLMRSRGIPWNTNLCSMAARGGHKHVLEWSLANGLDWSRYMCSEAAREGHLDLLTWARSNGAPWNDHVLAAAARGGHLNVLEMFGSNGECDEEVYLSAACGGHKHVLDWLVGKWGWDADLESRCTCLLQTKTCGAYEWSDSQSVRVIYDNIRPYLHDPTY